MMKFFFTKWRTGPDAREAPKPAWCRDPLLHPRLQDMSQRELADLPFPLVEAQPTCPERPHCAPGANGRLRSSFGRRGI